MFLPLTLWALVAVWPWRPVDISPVWKRDIEAIKCNDKLIGLPQLAEHVDNSLFHAGFPDEVFVRCSVQEIHSVRVVKL